MSMAQANDPDRWAQWRFAIIGPLLAAPPRQGQLRAALQALADKTWSHPIDGTAVHVSFATIERWFYQARKADQPVIALRRRPRGDHGRTRPSGSSRIPVQWAGRVDRDTMSSRRAGRPYGSVLGIDRAVRRLSTYFPQFSGVSRFLLKNDRF
jgi:putative transposase